MCGFAGRIGDGPGDGGGGEIRGGAMKNVLLAVVILGYSCSAATGGRAGNEGGPALGGTVVVPAGEGQADAGAGECAFEPIYFDYDESTLNPGAQEVLDRVVPCLLKSERPVVVEGYTDERGTEKYNLELGSRMARQVARYLEKSGVPEGRLKTVSYGEERPPCTESTEECWALMRRVEIRFE